MKKECISMLIDSLKKKEKILRDIMDASLAQAECVNSVNVDWDCFNELIDKKEKKISEIDILDKGFDSLYGEIKEELSNEKEKYKSEIIEMKDLITKLTKLSAEIEVLERRNKGVIERQFVNSKNNIKQSKLGNKVAAEYYQKMSRINTIDPQLMDKKH